MTENQLNLFQTMLKMQAGFNDSLSKDWRTRGIPYVDAIWTEAAEAFNYTNWPWWKNSKAPINVAQFEMEVIDIWHFLQSELMTYSENKEEGGTHLGIIQTIYEAERHKFETANTKVWDVELVKDHVRNVIRCALLPRDDARIVLILFAFFALMNSIGMSIEDLYKKYVGKNTLNVFRQNNNYKTQTQRYLMIWAAEAGKEDNEYLEDILKTLDIEKDIDVIREEITSKLQKQYDENLSLFPGEVT